MMQATAILIFLALALRVHAGVSELSKVRPAEAACNEYQKASHDEDSQTISIFDVEKAHLGEFPFIVSLKSDILHNNDLTHVCSGSLITNRHVLTTAYCINNNNAERKPVQAMLGAVTLNDTSNNVQVRSINKIMSHPKYRRSQNYYDIGIIELSIPVNITKYVRPICLQYKPELNLEASQVATGWGLGGMGLNFYSDDDPFDLLKTRSLLSIQQYECADHYNDFQRKLPRGIDNSMLCMLNRKTDFCTEGGAALVQRGNHTLNLIGLASFGQACGSPVPDVYSSIYYHLDWIEEVVWPKKDTNPE